MEEERTYTAFVGETRIASGPIETMLPVVKTEFDQNHSLLFLIFEDQSGRQVDFDLRGALHEVVTRALPTRPRSGPGRPKLGVTSREISLLPRHWDWLEQQPNGASAALRRLIDQARKREPDGQRARLATEAAGRIMSAMAGNLPGYEEASRALYAGNGALFEDLIRHWPHDIRAYLQRRAEDAFMIGDESCPVPVQQESLTKL
jgi:hypothetical protein